MNLKQAMYEVLATNFTYYWKIHIYHWNIVGEGFYANHKFLNDLYDDVWESIDGVAEQIRALDIVAPSEFMTYIKMSKIQGPGAKAIATNDIFTDLANDNEIFIESMKVALSLSKLHPGLENFLQDRVDKMEKWGWMLRSFIKA